MRESDERLPRGPRHFALLDGLRGALAVYVLLTHVVNCTFLEASGVPGWASRPFRYGQVAVDGFIVLSGFSLMLPVLGTPGLGLRGGVLGYLRRRARRILPAYYAALAFSLLVLAATARLSSEGATSWGLGFTARSIGSHLLLVHTLVPGEAETINAALWSIATEWQIYFLFPLLLLPAFRRSGAAGMLLVAFGLGMAPQLAAPRSAMISGCPWYLGLFALGAAAAAASASPAHPPRALLARFPLLAVAGSSAYALARSAAWVPWVHDLFGPRMLSDIVAGALWALVILAGVSLERLAGQGEPAPRPLPFRILSGPLAVALGGFSYSLYVTHTPILRALDGGSLLLHLPPAAALLLRALLGVPLSLGFAVLFARWFERPFTAPRVPSQSPSPSPAPEYAISA